MRRVPIAVRPLLLVVPLLLAGCVDEPVQQAPDEPWAHAELAGLRHFAEPVAAPDFTVESLHGETIQLSGLEGKVVFVEFMGAGCSTCRRNLPHHFELYEAHGQDPGFVFVAMDVWDNEDEADLRAYRDAHDIPWPMAMAPAATEHAYDVRGTPTQYFIDHEGRFHSRGGYVGSASLLAEADFLLGLRAGAPSP